jgi:long-chain acyl-CoA synthetase
MIQLSKAISPTRAQTAHLLDICKHNAERTVIVDARTGGETTYGQLLHDSLVMASFLQDVGVGPGEAVAFSMDNCVELACLYLACWHVGARAVPVNPSYHPRDYSAILEGISARWFFTSPAIRSRLEAVTASRPALRVFCFKPAVEICKAEHQALVNLDYAKELSRHAPSQRTFAEAGDDDIAVTMFTSGSTGLPKGINIRFGGLFGNGRVFCKRLGLGRESRFYNILAMTYLGGLYNLMLIPILAEGSFILDAVFGPTNVFGFWEQVREHKINTLWFSPTMLSMMLMLEADEDLSFVKEQVRVGICGMAPLAPELKARFEARFGFPLYENYGLSETTFVTTSAADLRPRPGSVGKPLEGVRVQILDPELRPLPAGRDGQVAVQSPYLMAGYDRDGDVRQLTAASRGWFLTGDLGRLDKDGELFITGRLKDIIIRGGVNISPKVLEDVMYGMEAVQEAAVVGVPHPLYGEEVALVVKLRDGWTGKVTVDDVRRYCEAHVAHFQRPKFIFFIDQIPKGATGKIQKAVLKKLLTDKLDPLNG